MVSKRPVNLRELLAWTARVLEACLGPILCCYSVRTAAVCERRRRLTWLLERVQACRPWTGEAASGALVEECGRARIGCRVAEMDLRLR